MKNNEPKKVAIYIRVSTLDQARDGYSLAAQEHALQDYCNSRGYTIHHVYADKGISGKDIKHRPDMQQMLTDAKSKNFNVILVWSLSRLTRSVADLYNTWGLLTKLDINLVSYTESFDTSTPTGRAMMGLLGVFAQMEREITAERTRAAMGERAAQGKRTCNEVLGYDLFGKDSLQINETEAERVRYIYNKFAECKNFSVVAELCRLKGYRGKRGRTFKGEHIKIILTRPIYVGYHSYCGQIFKGDHDPIIELRQFNKIQKILRKPLIQESKDCQHFS